MYRFVLIAALFFFQISCKEKEIAYTPSLKKSAEDMAKDGIKRHVVDSVYIATFENDSLTSFYKMNGFKTVWNTPQLRQLIIEELSTADKEGLESKDYNTSDLDRLEKNMSSLTEKEIANYEIQMTLSIQKYLMHLTRGKLNPKELYTDWDLTPNYAEINQLLTAAIVGDSLQIVIEKAKPNHIVYKRLKEALVLINKFPTDTLKKIEISGKLKVNDTSQSLFDIKRRLMYWKDIKVQDSLTSLYDPETEKGIRRFQSRHGLAADGVIGASTIMALNIPKNVRKEQIIANLERWRWFPRNMGEHYLIINIPDYKLHAVFKNDTTRTHNVIVGTSKRKTPVLSSKLSYAVFNPTWTIPPTILKEDIIPATTKNRNYLTGKNITVYDKNGKEVSASSWNPEKALNYRYVQSPGTYNSLGMVKIMFPNNFTVYLHDTNHREYFDKTNRSLSSGCVRVQNPLELTEYLLDDKKNWSLEKITETLKKEKTQSAKIKNDIAIYQLYWTAWSHDNTLQFRPDIYTLDNGLYQKLRN
ncbi:L,D-transpeptidase family protein [Flavobacterium microcysteis]|uniref:Peptidoglycan-binding protein n=1 Tax=Flavobacterium microcysteis TaxID=2596891 RepID=A0A501Q0R3_9FLAO|nr:L,D-transpeptidase family protein [Flavobacterium microcysteis]TPD65606.1 peptidoglycan-binding protein [Flavobacterium microcysteis]